MGSELSWRRGFVGLRVWEEGNYGLRGFEGVPGGTGNGGARRERKRGRGRGRREGRTPIVTPGVGSNRLQPGGTNAGLYDICACVCRSRLDVSVRARLAITCFEVRTFCRLCVYQEQAQEQEQEQEDCGQRRGVLIARLRRPGHTQSAREFAPLLRPL